MGLRRNSNTRIIVFFFLTAVVVLIATRIIFQSKGVRGEIVLKEQFRYFEKMSPSFPQKYKVAVKKDIEKVIFSLIGSSFVLPETDFQYYSYRKIKTKKVRGVFVPFIHDNHIFLMGIYTLGDRGGEGEEDFLDAATLLSGRQNSVAFVVLETKGGLKVSLMSTATVEEIFDVMRSNFMDL